MSPRRLRNSIIRVVIIAPVGIHDPRWSGDAATVAGNGALMSDTVGISGPQSADDVQEP